LSFQAERKLLLNAYQAAIRQVGGRASVARYMKNNDADYVTHLAAVGKAAIHMAAGALDVIGDRVESALVITKRGYDEPLFQNKDAVRVMESSHPVPDVSSLAAGAALHQFVREAPPDAGLLLLVSGGASSLVEVLPEGVVEDKLARINSWLLASGLPIGAMNRVRKRVSRIKGGRLADALNGRRALCLMISDVPGDDPKVIGSGPLVPHEPDDIDVSGIDLPDWLQAIADRAPPLSDNRLFDKVRWEIVARPEDARKAAGEELTTAKRQARIHGSLLEGEAAKAGAKTARRLIEGPPGAEIWASETTVVLPERPGRGGRCQSFALAAALEIAGRDDIVLLAAGTDGSDGPGEDAGALVDGETIQRGQLAGLDPRRCLESADAGSFLDASGDLLNTGPTGTNVMDLIIGLKRP
jgi:glycerate 2-kinase